MDSNRMMSVTPFMAQADFNQNEDGEPDLRDVQVVGIVEGSLVPSWVAVETVDGWEYPVIVPAVRWNGKGPRA